MSLQKGRSFELKAADGQTVEIPAGEWYINPKARTRRMMLDSLSSDARRVYACLELATMGFSQELAVTMEGGKQRPLTPADVKRQTGLRKQDVRDALAELEGAGMGERRAAGDNGLRKGEVLIYSWADPRPAGDQVFQVPARRYLNPPSWVPDSCKPLLPYLSYCKIRLPDDLPARGYLEALEELARRYQTFQKDLARTLEGTRAPKRINKEERNRKELRERNPSSSSAVLVTTCAADKAEEEKVGLYHEFKKNYPPEHFDEPKAKPSFDGLTLPQKRAVLERLAVYQASERWRDEGGRWIPLASTWLKTYDADPPPLIRKKAAAAADSRGDPAESLRLAEMWRNRGGKAHG